MSLFDHLDDEPELVDPPKAPKKKVAKKTARKKTVPAKKTEPAQELPPQSSEPVSVTELTARIRETLENRFDDVWVIGELSNLVRPRSGHVYVTLKDQGAQIPAVMWKTLTSRLKFELKDGMEVVCRGRVEVYPPHGKYQLIVTEMEPRGIGALELAFRQLHAKLAAEGLFEPQRKRPIPRWIRRVAVITSISGAALRDFLQVLGRRTHRLDVRIVPVKVQGEGAAKEIAAAIHLINTLNENNIRNEKEPFADCIVVTRGGGSLEDLWAFNEEPLVRAVAASQLPTISAVGHEIDVSLCDLAADLRALTPSEAAERIAPEDSQLRREFLRLRQSLEAALEKTLQVRRERLRALSKHPILARPEKMLEDRLRKIDLLEQSLDRAADRLLKSAKERVTQKAVSLEALSPLSVLARGYSLTQREDGSLVTDASTLQKGDRLKTRLANGTFESEVTQEPT